jgi:predicted DNA binding CopG/RHH family protein
MKYFELDSTEEELLRDFESGTLVSVKSATKEKARYRQYADALLQKSKSINIRISEHDLIKLKGQALEEGLPYQTYLSSLIHKNLKREQRNHSPAKG